MSQLNKMVGREIEMFDGRKVKITEVYGYEPSDASVGIWSGYLMVMCDDGEEYDIEDSGKVYNGYSLAVPVVVGNIGFWGDTLGNDEDNSTRE